MDEVKKTNATYTEGKKDKKKRMWHRRVVLLTVEAPRRMAGPEGTVRQRGMRGSDNEGAALPLLLLSPVIP